MTEPIAVAFLQNMWFKNPARMRKIYAGYLEREETGLGRQRFIRDFLFFGCVTGRRLDAAFEPVFGDDWRWRIWWEEASDQWGGHAASNFGFNSKHIATVLIERKPAVVLLFGKVAVAGFESAVRNEMLGEFRTTLLIGPHPAARTANVPELLRGMAHDLAAHFGVTA